MMARRAVQFAASIEAQFRRTGPRAFATAASVLRRPPQPVRMETRIHIDARTLRLITGPDVAAPFHWVRTEPKRAELVARLVERRIRADPKRLDVRRPAPVGDVPRSRSVAQRAESIRPVAPVQMVLARSVAAAANATPARSTASPDSWPSPGGARVQQPRATVQTDGSSPALSVSQLTERVVAAIDRRMWAARERLGG